MFLCLFVPFWDSKYQKSWNCEFAPQTTEMSLSTDDAIEISSIAASFLIVVGYHLRYRSSGIGRHQRVIDPLWAEIHEKKSGNSLIAVQMLRNIMSISTVLAAAGIGATLFIASLWQANVTRGVELVVVCGLYLLSFLNFAMCARVTYHLTFFIVLYPKDLIQEGTTDVEDAQTNERKVRLLLRLLGKHFAFGRRALFVAVPATFVLAHPAAMLAAMLLSVFVWYYLDNQFGVTLAGVPIRLPDPPVSRRAV